MNSGRFKHDITIGLGFGRIVENEPMGGRVPYTKPVRQGERFQTLGNTNLGHKRIKPLVVQPTGQIVHFPV